MNFFQHVKPFSEIGIVLQGLLTDGEVCGRVIRKLQPSKALSVTHIFVVLFLSFCMSAFISAHTERVSLSSSAFDQNALSCIKVKIWTVYKSHVWSLQLCLRYMAKALSQGWTKLSRFHILIIPYLAWVLHRKIKGR